MSIPHVYPSLVSRLLVLAIASLSSLKAGDIAGRVFDSKTDNYLVGAFVTDTKSGRIAITDGEGRFTLTNLPAGTITLEIESIGYDTRTESVSVPDEGTVRPSIAMSSDVVQLGAFTVEGYREGRAKALQQKRTAAHFEDIISADSVGNLPDRNVADALSRVTGVSVIADNGEGRFLSIRGADPNLNTVTFNGATLAAPGVDGRSGRAMPLDVVSSSQISQIEVVKTLTPDLDATGIGGAVNIRTASAFDRKERVLQGSMAGGYSTSADKSLYEGDLSFADRFGKNEILGIALSASYSLRSFRTESVLGNWSEQTLGGQSIVVPSRLRFVVEDGERERIGFNANVEIRPRDERQFYFRAILNEFTDENIGEEILNDSRSGPSLVDATTIQWAQARSDRRAFNKYRQQNLLNLTLGGHLTFGKVTVSPEVTYSWAQEKRPRRLASAEFLGNNTSAAPLQFGFSEFLPDFAAGPAWTDPARFPLSRVIYDQSMVEETTWTPRLDVEWKADSLLRADSGSIKVGGKTSWRERFVHDTSDRYRGAPTLATTGAAGPGQSLLGKYNTGLSIDYYRMRQYIDANLGSLTFDEVGSVQNSIEDTYDLDEEITAGYAMATATYGRMTWLGGVRWEHTEGTIEGFEYRTNAGQFIGVFPNRGEMSYDNYLPNLQLRFAANKNFIVRAAISSSIGRPKFEDAAPKAQLSWTTAPDPFPEFPYRGSVEIGNPDLQPYEALNFDVSVEYYIAAGGLVSVAGFHKEVENPIYTRSDDLTNVQYIGLGFEQLEVSTLRNADKGTISGVELGVQWPLQFLPRPLDGLGIEVNYTLIDSEVTVFERPGETLPFFEQPDRLANLALYYQMGRVQARVAWNYQSRSLTELQGSPISDYYRGDRYTIDAQLGLKLNERFTVFVNGSNLTNETQEIYYGDAGRVRELREFGYNLRGGLRFNF